MIITHLLSCDIPKNGFAKLFFFTKKNGKYFWGTDDSIIGSIDIRRWMKNGEIIELTHPIEITNEEELFIGSDDGPAIYSGTLIGNKKMCGTVKDLCKSN